MSERVISDPTVAGWELNPDTGYWMWAAGGGSIQDGDTEGQITTWDGDEWTPASDINVSSGILKLFDRGSGQGEVRLYHEDDNTDFVVRGSPGSMGTFSISASDGGTANQRMTIDADGGVILSHPAHLKGRRASGNLPLTLIGYEEGTNNVELVTSGRWAVKDGALDTLFSIDADTGSVNITGRLFINGDEVTAGGGGGGLWTDNGDGTISSAKTAKAPDFIAG